MRIAAEHLEQEGARLTGVIQLSPAMPFGIISMTKSLWRVMKGRLRELLSGKMIFPTAAEYELLVAPLPNSIRDAIIAVRQPVSGTEGRTLAFFPPRFVGYAFPTLHIFGKCDAWISPSAQRKLGKKLGKRSNVTTREITGAGHLTLASEKRDEVIQAIQQWIANLNS